MIEVKKDLLLLANINPVKKRRTHRTIREAEALKAELEKDNFIVDLRFTPSADDARKILEESAGDGRAVISFGGDGTLRGLVKTEMDIRSRTQQERLTTTVDAEPEVETDDPRLFIVPRVGSVNLLANAIGMPHFSARRARKTAEAIKQGLCYPTDIIGVQIDGGEMMYAVDNVTLGPSAKIFKGDRPLGLGGPAYALNAPGAIANAEHLDAEVGFTGEDSTVRRSLATSTDFIAQGGANLGLFPKNPGKRFDDGEIELMLLHGVRNPIGTALMTAGAAIHDSFTGGRPTRSEERIRIQEIAIFLNKPTPFQMDGDYVEKEDGSGEPSEKIVLVVIPAAIRVLAPDQSKPKFLRRILGRRAYNGTGEEIKWLDP